MAQFHWIPRRRHFDREQPTTFCQAALLHPLKARLQKIIAEPTSTTAQNTKETTNEPSDFVDPLGATLDDPLRVAGVSDLSLFAGENRENTRQNDAFESKLENTLVASPKKNVTNRVSDGGDDVDFGDDFENWTVMKTRILAQPLTPGRMTMITSFLPGGTAIKQAQMSDPLSPTQVVQLDTSNTDDRPLMKLSNLSQHDFLANLSTLKKQLQLAWTADRRVESIKIVLECVKLLTDISVTEFYAHKFLYIVDILDMFGKFVYDRLLYKANGKPILHSDTFSSQDVPESVQETALNWFSKIASIHEILPRIYLETSIVRCRRFIDHSMSTGDNLTTSSNYRSILAAHLYRLMTETRGVANVLVTAYLRVYIAKTGTGIFPVANIYASHAPQHVWRAVHDTIGAWRQCQLKGDWPHAEVFWPPLRWLIQCVAVNSSTEDLLPLFEYCRQDNLHCTLLLQPMLSHLPTKTIAAEAITFAQLILVRHQNTKEIATELEATLISQFGACLLRAPASSSARRTLLRHVWAVIMRMPNIDDYLKCAQYWLAYACTYFGMSEVCALLDDILRHVKPDAQFTQHTTTLMHMLRTIVEKCDEYQYSSVPADQRLSIRRLYETQQFVAFIDLFTTTNYARKDVSLTILREWYRFVRTTDDVSQISADLLLAGHIMGLCKSLHDSVTAVTAETEQKDTARLITASLNPFTQSQFMSAEHFLDTMVEARASFSNLDDVTEYLCHRMCTHIVYIFSTNRHRFSRSLAAHVRACVAYVYITVCFLESDEFYELQIPSITDHLTRMRLYVHGANIALMAVCLPQTDALLKAAIQLIPECPPCAHVAITDTKSQSISNEPALSELIRRLLALLLLVPDAPENERVQPLYMFNGLYNAVNKFSWRTNSPHLSTVLCELLTFLSLAAQSDYPYHVDGVESNDSLYGSSDVFLSAVARAHDTILAQVLQIMREMKRDNEIVTLVLTAVHLSQVLLINADLNEVNMRELLTMLVGIVVKNGGKDARAEDRKEIEKHRRTLKIALHERRDLYPFLADLHRNL